MTTQLNALVRTPDGEVTTIAKLADAGRIRFTACTMTTKKRAGERKEVVRYFADLIDPTMPEGQSTGWQIGKMAYLSRMQDEAERAYFDEDRIAEDRQLAADVFGEPRPFAEDVRLARYLSR